MNQRNKLKQPELATMLDDALKHHQAGRLLKAKKIYRKILKKDSTHNDALHMLGLLEQQNGNNDAAIRLYKKAMIDSQHTPELLTNYGNALTTTGKPEEAITAFEKAVKINPDFALAHNNLANVLSSIGRKDDALESLKKAITFMPNYAEAHFNLANLLNDTGKQDEAIKSFRQAISIEPNFVEAINNLAKLVMDNGDKEEAISLLDRVIVLDKNHGVAQHLLASLQGKTTSSTPESYVVGLFDGAAGYFDEHLVNELDYKVPEFMEAAVSDLLADKNNSLNILDLGCGTGLCGTLFKRYARKLVGVDLAPKMLEQAKQKNVYDELIKDDITSVLLKSKEKFDLILAGDVFIYVGELRKVFEAAVGALNPGGLFVFSIESGDEVDNYSLLTTGRYAHSLNYIKTLTEESKLDEVFIIEKTLRIDRGSEIKGFIVGLKNNV